MCQLTYKKCIFICYEGYVFCFIIHKRKCLKVRALQGFLQLLRTYKLSQEMPAYQVHALQHGTYQAIEL